MERKAIFGAAAVAAFVALASIIGMMVATSGLPAGVTVQPYGIDSAQVLSTMTSYTDSTLLFFSSDTLFPISYALVFVGIYAITAERARPLALVGIGTGILTALFDVSENALFITYALMIRSGATVAADVVSIYVLTTLKWTMAFATFYSFGLAFPRGRWFEWLITALMLIFPLWGAATTALPDLIPTRGLFMLGGMLLLGVYFIYRFREA
jgi:hypothetical protein